MRKRIESWSVLLVVLLLLCGCGSAKMQGTVMPTPVPAAAYGNYYAAEEEMAAYDGDYGFNGMAMQADETRTENPADAPEENPDKIIYSADVTVESTDFENTLEKLDSLISVYGAWVESSSISGSNYYQLSRGNASLRSASYTLRVPSSRFREMMNNLTELGNIPYSHVYTENVTSQYYDTQARLTAYQTQETRLLEMMELAESVEDVIIIEDRLTELRYRIESLQTNLNNWDRRVSYSTVSLTVKEVQEYTPEVNPNPSYGEELLQALKDGLSNAGQFLKELLKFLVEILPVLIILIPVIWLIVWLIKKLVRRLRKRKSRRKEKPVDKPVEEKEKT